MWEFARHQGMNLLCELYDEGFLRYPYLVNRWRCSFFRGLSKGNTITSRSWICPYIHKPAGNAPQIYELGLRYYTFGLIYANAPNPLPTIGSLIVIHRELIKNLMVFQIGWQEKILFDQQGIKNYTVRILGPSPRSTRRSRK